MNQRSEDEKNDKVCAFAMADMSSEVVLVDH